MPLLITPATPFRTTAQLDCASVYCLIRKVGYDTDTTQIEFVVSYYASVAARDARADTLSINALPTGFVQAATPDEADAVPIFQFLEQVLTAQLTALLGPNVVITHQA